ncbi:hypothetical protein [Arenimonas composti]|uniref:STAS/SEC14 domain-containing protein n=1 Tax=Arenimonas composti TR7-09 = DSM 18010 TaxID=1121013 RepID=A0A091B910_9GAMM|nr:hypothetical protein [Arenimonas composti]KFN48236.1 hypothetical protein P873_01380 [Arenimonas composti TR7-09 = DSM 18010]
MLAPTPPDPGLREFHLHGERSLGAAIDAVDTFLRTAVADGVRGVLVDVRGLGGFAPPDLAARAAMVRRFAAICGGRLHLAMLCPPHYLDEERFGVVMARGLGLEGAAFEDEAEARAWLAQSAGTR